MSEQATSVADLQRMALESHREHYKELSEGWKNLETKAQGLVAICGIFLAATFSWAKDLPEKGYGYYDLVLILLSLVCLVAAIIASVMALQVRLVVAPPFGRKTAEMIRDILQAGDELPQRVWAFYNDQITLWSRTNSEMGVHCRSKANAIRFGQFALVISALLVAFITFMSLVAAMP